MNDNLFIVTFTSMESLSVPTAQQRVAAYAMQLCQKKGIRLGKYKYENNETISKGGPAPKSEFILNQNVHCENLKKSANTSNNPVVNIDETKTKALIQDLTIKYFTFQDQGNFEEAYSMLTQNMKSYTNSQKWKDERKSFYSLSGKAINKDIWKVTIYINPPSAPEGGIYVAADYENSYDNIPFYCGYLVWIKLKNGNFKVIREEKGYIDSSIIKKLKPNELENIKLKMKCKAL